MLVLAFAFACTAVISTPASAAPSKKSAGGGSSRFVKVATHPEAAAQSTAMGRTIATLKAFEGKLYSGYGDYGANTGPIAIDPLDAGSFRGPVLSADTEAVWSYRQIGGRLYAPSIDPRKSATFAVGGGGLSTWSNPTAFAASHVFDMVTLDGQDLWAVGSQGSDAVAWRSLDGGTSWTELLRVAPMSTDGGDYARFYAAGTLEGRLYLQAMDARGGLHPGSMVFDAGGWSAGPSLDAVFTHTEEMDGRLLFHGTYHSALFSGSLMTFDGASSVTVYSSIYDYTVADGRVYVLTTGGDVMSSADLATWQQVGRAPSSARSIGVLDGVVYLGGTDSAIYRQK